MEELLRGEERRFFREHRVAQTGDDERTLRIEVQNQGNWIIEVKLFATAHWSKKSAPHCRRTKRWFLPEWQKWHRLVCGFGPKINLFQRSKKSGSSASFPQIRSRVLRREAIL